MNRDQLNEAIKRGAITAAEAAKIAREIRAGIKASFKA